MTASQWVPYRESLRTTLLRNVAIAVVVTIAVVAMRHTLAVVPLVLALALWPTFGGHFVEVFFLNWLRPQLPASRAVQLAARLVLWFAAGTVFLMGMQFTASLFPHALWQRWPAWWVGAVAFIGIELVAHAGLQLRGQGSVYNGRG